MCRTLLGDGNVTANGDQVIPTNKSTDPQLTRAQERIRELELELAQTKLAHVEAECRNQVRPSGIFILWHIDFCVLIYSS
jgi:hypothetical protein